VRWQSRVGVFRRGIADGKHAEIVIAERAYRVRVREPIIRLDTRCAPLDKEIDKAAPDNLCSR